jgi:hypothetical protein
MAEGGIVVVKRRGTDEYFLTLHYGTSQAVDYPEQILMGGEAFAKLEFCDKEIQEQLPRGVSADEVIIVGTIHSHPRLARGGWLMFSPEDIETFEEDLLNPSRSAMHLIWLLPLRELMGEWGWKY